MRLTVNVDLEENEILDEKILEAVKGSARKIARETIDKEMTKEIERKVNNILNDEDSSYYHTNKLEAIITTAVKKHFEEIIKGTHLSSRTDINEKIDSTFDIQVSRALSRVGIKEPEDLLRYIDRKVESEVQKSLLGAVINTKMNS